MYQKPDIYRWKEVTDKGMVIVNSSGNTQNWVDTSGNTRHGFQIAAQPGYFATVTDDSGNLILGGKVLIVGGVDSNTGAIASWSNWAGHLCVNVVDNKCNDQYKVSDFYVLAPGWSYSTKNDGTYDTSAGTSMAAPFVTGQVAILHQMWPHMKGENLVRLVTTTADKNINGYDVIFLSAVVVTSLTKFSPFMCGHI
jgi:subtilisin family serine protease